MSVQEMCLVALNQKTFAVMQKGEPMDLIERQAAIELIHSLYPSSPIMPMNRKRWKKKYKPYIEAEKALEMLPSAEPEVIHCKDCKYIRYDTIFKQAWCNHPKGVTMVCDDAKEHCGRAERKTDG